MKVWKSPVFYFGILLVIAVAGLLVAPFVVDWNSYRADLEAYGKKLTGRTVKIEGPVSVRLFPWPSLTAERVAIANPSGLETPDFATIRRIVVRMTIAGLARGGIDVESIDIEEPSIHLERLATGEGNWQFTPSADLIKSDVLSRVRLDQIQLKDGSISFRDHRRGEIVSLDDFNAQVDSPGVAGPWRLRSLSLYNDRVFDISASTGLYKEGEPFRFALRVAAGDHSGFAYSFDGAQIGGNVEGQLRIEPAAADDGKADAEGSFRPLVFTANVKADFDQIDLQKIEVSPLDLRHGGTLTSGEASFRLGQHIDARVALSAAMLDLDELAGAKSRDLLREAGSLALADSLLALLPGNMSLVGKVNVTALKTGGETLDNVAIAIEAERGALRIGQFSTGLPGRSEMLFKGVYFPGETGAELSGSLALEANDLRALTLWAWPEGRDTLGGLWTGSRGRFKMQTDVSLTPARLRLTKTEYELDGERGKAELAVTSAGRGAVDLRIDGNRLDIDSFAPQGVPAVSAAAGQGIGALAALALPHDDAPDLRLNLKAAELLLNGVTAANVTVDLQSGSNGLDLRTLSIGSVGGAMLEATGLILDSGKGADGSIGLDIKAADPTELLRLLGLSRGDDPPVWARDLGPMALRGDLGVKPAEGGSRISVSLDGSAGQLALSGDGTAEPDGGLSGSMKIGTPGSARLLALFGLSPQGAESQPGQIDIQAAGTMKDGFMANASLQAFGARLDYRGPVNPAAQMMGLDGRLSLRSTDVTPLLTAAGLPVSQLPGGVLVADADLRSETGGLKLASISGRLGQEKFSGTADIDPQGKLGARLEAGHMRLMDVLAAAFLDWTGAAPDIERSFASALPFGVTGEIWIKPSALEIHPHFTARDAEIGIIAETDKISLAMFGKDEKGRNAQVDLSSSGADASRILEGRISIPVDLARQMALAGGVPVVEGLGLVEVKFDSAGRSPGGALANLRGSGSFGFDDFRLLGITPSAFATALAEAKDAPGVTAAFDALRSGAGLDFGAVSGTITITEGEVGFLPFGFKSPEADIQVKTVAELALGEIDAEITLSLKAREQLPAMRISYAGPPSELARAEDNAELATKLGVTIMQQGIDELERLQEEQRRLAEEEERQRIVDEQRLAAYYAQRDELLLRKRELKVHAEMRVAEAERLRKQIESERAANAEINKNEVKERVREIRVYRRLGRQAQSAPPKPAAAVKPAAPKPAAKAPASSPPRRKQETVGPVILANPKGAPVIISPPPGSSPSQ
jgi:hypothetical protein